MRLKTNRRINIWRPSTPSGISAAQSAVLYWADIRAWVKFASSVIVTADGVEVAADGEVTIRAAYPLQRNDILGVVDTTERYRVEAVEEILSPRGRILGRKAFLLRDSSLEA